jgi:hypothetical protein
MAGLALAPAAPATADARADFEAAADAARKGKRDEAPGTKEPQAALRRLGLR